MSSKDEDSGKSVVAPLDIPDDLKSRLPSAKSGGSGRRWIIIGLVIATVLGLGIWQLMSSSGPGTDETAHPTTTFGK